MGHERSGVTNREESLRVQLGQIERWLNDERTLHGDYSQEKVWEAFEKKHLILAQLEMNAYRKRQFKAILALPKVRTA